MLDIDIHIHKGENDFYYNTIFFYLAVLALISVLSELNSAPLFYHNDFANLIKAFETAAIVMQWYKEQQWC